MRFLLLPPSPLSLLLRQYSSTSPPPPKLKNLLRRHRPRALREARAAILDYLHATRSLPFTLADLISSHSPFSLSLFVASLPLPPSPRISDLPSLLRRHLSYRPINEYDFFFESIGLPPSPSPSHLGPFLSDDQPLLAAVSALLHFGFPFTHLGLLYKQNNGSIFQENPDSLLARLNHFESVGLRRVSVIGICLAFPSTLSKEIEPNGEFDLLFKDMKTVFVDYDLASWVGDSVDSFLEICRRMRVFYDSGSEKGKMGELMGKERRFFLEFPEVVLEQKLRFFSTLGMRKEEVGPFILRNRELLEFDLESPEIAMPEYLVKIGLGEEEAVSIANKYPYVMGRNKLGSLPGMLRSMNLHEWFLEKVVKDGNIQYLLPDYAFLDSYDKEMEDEFVRDLEKIKSVMMHKHVDPKVEFLLSIGFGQNKITTRAVKRLHGTKEVLQERFDCLLGMGLEYSMLCRIISASPKLLNQGSEMLCKKVKYLCQDLNYSLEYLNSFPAFLCFDLENRIKPRFRIINWLMDNGLLKQPFAPGTVLANSEKRFMTNLSGIHPAAPKQWLECFSSRSQSNGNRKNILFMPRP